MKEDFKEDFTHPLNLVSYLRIYDNVLSKPIHENIIDISKSPIAKFKKATIHQDTTIGTWNPKVNEEIRLNIYDINGRKVKTLISSFTLSGSYSIRWNGTNQRGNNMPSGIYIYQLLSSTNSATKKMILLR